METLKSGYKKKVQDDYDRRHGATHRSLKGDDEVQTTEFENKRTNWEHDTVKSRTGSVNCDVIVEVDIVRKHANQMNRLQAKEGKLRSREGDAEARHHSVAALEESEDATTANEIGPVPDQRVLDSLQNRSPTEPVTKSLARFRIESF